MERVGDDSGKSFLFCFIGLSKNKRPLPSKFNFLDVGPKEIDVPPVPSHER